MKPFLAALASGARVPVSVIPTRLRAFGGYDETPQEMAANLREMADDGWVNIAGSCCGSTPEHTRAIAETMRGVTPRRAPERPRYTLLSGLEPLEIRPDSNFINVGERTNVTGSARFRSLIKEDNYEAAPHGRANRWKTGHKSSATSTWTRASWIPRRRCGAS
jgi:5-methyltetrahydrofolate--homocysteine methyltransferase